MAELFKFRCYQCQKLIGAPASKHGKVVNCPRCGVELIVPLPGAEGEAESPVDPIPDPDAFQPDALGLSLQPERIGRPDAPSARPPDPLEPNPVAFLERVVAQPPPVPDEPIANRNEPTDDADLPDPQLEPLLSRKPGQRRNRPSETTSRARDVILPRTAAVAWSMFGLLGLAFAFGSGILLGHFLWK